MARMRVLIPAAITALMSACGGGGGGSSPFTAPAPAPGVSPAPAPATATTISANTQATPNASYAVNATGTTAIDVTLPATSALKAGDTVSVKGVGTAPWRITQNAGQTVVTTNLPGNVAPGTIWTSSGMDPKVWHWISMDAGGDVILGAEASGGFLDTSTDGGKTWQTGTIPGIWISSDISANAERMVAVQYGGGLYTSTDRGVTWTAASSASVNLAGQSYESVTISRDGQRIAAVIQNGPLVLSNDGGANWTAPTIGGQPTHYWRAVDNSADGSVIVAADQAGTQLFLSTDAGVTWSPVTVAVGSPATPVFEGWYRVKMSADGNTIAVAANEFGGSPGTGIYVSHDRGQTWTKGFTLTADYTALAMSDDGQTISASVSNPNVTGSTAATGRMLLSTDGGATFNELTMPGTDTDWRAVAMSADGTRMAAATGLFLTGATGQLYLSQGNRTSLGTLGYIQGGQNESIELQYVANGQFKVLTSAGGTFTIQ